MTYDERYNVKPQFFIRVFIILLMISYFCFGQTMNKRGTIQGKLLDTETKVPLVGANIEILNTTLGAGTNMEGNFVIENVPVGSYTIQFSYIGYQSMTITDVIVRSQRITFIEEELKISVLESDEVLVTTGYFRQKDDQPVSIIGFSREEIRRAPGSAGDVSRIIQSLPSIAKVNDQSNNLVVRGGNPIENTFYIDNIEITNINHFPSQGFSGGPIGMINVDLIENVEFYTGGFSVAYGDRLSSIMNLSFREGNKNQFDGQLDLNFAGFGGVVEGPISAEKASYLFSVRRSYLDFLIDKINVGSTIAPTFGDFQGKLVYDAGLKHKLTFLGFVADDHMTSDQENAIANQMVYYADQDIFQNTAGINWRALWNKSGYSNTSLSYSSVIYDEDIFETGTAEQIKQNRSLEQSIHLRSIAHLRVNSRNSLEFGFEWKYRTGTYDNWYAAYTDAFGNLVPPLIIDRKIQLNQVGIFLNYTVKPLNRFTGTLGVRTDYASHNKQNDVSPRISLSYQITDLTSLNASTGLFYQNLPLILLVSNEKNKELKNPRAVHYIIGIKHMLTASANLTVEFYRKNYTDFPVDPQQSRLFLLDEILFNDSFFFNTNNLNATGQAYSQGVEFMVQKKLAKDIYGLISASYFQTRYQDDDDIWYCRIYDNRFLFSMDGGYKPNEKWEFSFRWIFAGGRPFTPFDMKTSHDLNRAVFDENRINEDRYPEYHNLNIRVDRRFYFNRTNLVFYLSVWNVYNRKNVATNYWNQVENRPDVIYQWSSLPIFGIEYEF